MCRTEVRRQKFTVKGWCAPGELTFGFDSPAPAMASGDNNKTHEWSRGIGNVHYVLTAFALTATGAWCSEGGTNLYSNVFKQINESLAVYERCKVSNASGCSLCHYQVIARDLAPWASGIEKRDIDRAKQFGVHYQIIGGRLYRDPECMFPFR
ncbi:O-glucosyltransferase rumi-like [Tropilaelaps mercedesae]|uniref:O-glucosyltransferase rumi-like n=1 Tax=Tropilaelaps mercedesae TaxID=418985 RepID=A0A1V9X6U5_9ACAR|nr:O-glucosyltransferase rumi-like [Tropilaelaps mercedesae]